MFVVIPLGKQFYTILNFQVTGKIYKICGLFYEYKYPILITANNIPTQHNSIEVTICLLNE